MVTYDINGQIVYSDCRQSLTACELANKARAEPSKITGVYFFQVDGDRNVIKVPFNKTNIGANKSGLMVEIKNNSGEIAAITLSGLEEITSFLAETDAIGDLSLLTGKSVTSYRSSLQLYGIGINPN
jgi:hypothetical protein